MRPAMRLGQALAAIALLALAACQLAEPGPPAGAAAARGQDDPILQGRVDGRRYSQPALGFAVTVPEGFAITSTAAAMTAAGPGDARFTLDADSGDAPAADPLGRYIARVWVPELARRSPVGRLTKPRPDRINGLEAASATLPVLVKGRAYDALLVAVRHDGRIYRMLGLAPRAAGMLDSFTEAARSFRRLAPAATSG